jgi:hypothetical protein
VQPPQRVHQPRRIELERAAVGTVLDDLIAVDAPRQPASPIRREGYVGEARLPPSHSIGQF